MRKFKKAIAFTLTALLTLSSLGTTTAKALEFPKWEKPEWTTKNVCEFWGLDIPTKVIDGTEYHCIDFVNWFPCTHSEEYHVKIDTIQIGSWQGEVLVAKHLPGEGGADCPLCNPPHVHTSADAVQEKVVAATCMTEGSYDEVVYCSVCNEEISRVQKTIPAGHTAVTDAAIAATCTTIGWTEGSHCDVCGETLVAQTEIPATGHTAATDAAIAATCTTIGWTEGSHCSVCGEILVAQTEIPANGHDVVTDAAIAATCTTTGLTEGSHCSVCEEILVAQEVIPVDEDAHDWGEWEKADDYETSGKGKRVCKNDPSHVEYMDAISTGFYVLLEGTTYGEKNGVDKSFSSDLFVTVSKEGKLHYDAVGTNNIDDIPKAFVVSPTIEQVYAAIEKAVKSGKEIYTADGKKLTEKILKHNTNIPVTWYVLKQQKDGWHVDGVASLKELAKVNVNYVVDKDTFTASILKGTAEAEAKTPAPVEAASEAAINYENQNYLEFTGWVLQENNSFENGEIVADITFIAEFQEIPAEIIYMNGDNKVFTVDTKKGAVLADVVKPDEAAENVTAPSDKEFVEWALDEETSSLDKNGTIVNGTVVYKAVFKDVVKPTTPVPTTEPTPVPTTVPTTEPSPVPTTVPTTEPTPVPTTVPTTEPTPVPTTVPTTEPTPVPTTEPTPEPTVVPTEEPEEIEIEDEDTPEGLPEVTPGAEPEETPEDTPEVPDETSDIKPEVDPEEEIDIADEETPEGTPEIEIEDEENALGDVDVLPKTGLASTTVFFMAGAVLVLAGVVVVARKKEENA